MTSAAYNEALKTAGKFIIMVDNSVGQCEEIQKVFDRAEDAHVYARNNVKHTRANLIDIYTTTGKPCRCIDGITVRDDIKPYRRHYIGPNW